MTTTDFERAMRQLKDAWDMDGFAQRSIRDSLLFDWPELYSAIVAVLREA